MDPFRILDSSPLRELLDWPNVRPTPLTKPHCRHPSLMTDGRNIRKDRISIFVLFLRNGPVGRQPREDRMPSGLKHRGDAGPHKHARQHPLLESQKNIPEELPGT